MHTATRSRSPHNALHLPSISAVRTYSVNASSTLLTRTLRTLIRAGGISKRTRGQRIKTVLELCGTQSRRVLLLSSNPEFFLQRFRLQVVLPTATLEELSNQRRSKKIGDGAETKATELDVLQRQN